MESVTIGVEVYEGQGAMVRVFILSAHPLFGQGVESLLRLETGLEIAGRETDVDKAIGRIRELRPDAVILDNSSPVCLLTPTVVDIFAACPGVRVVGLNLENNTACIYSGEQRVVESAEDFFEAIKSKAPACGNAT